ncbi:MAG: hypothetical protein ACR2LF_13295 [Jatrophihabitantaceae bacterium]
MSRAALNWLGVALVCGCAVLAAVLELMFVPLYAGGALVPVSVLFAVASNVAFPRLARELLDSTIATVAPFAAWLVPMLVLSMTPRSEGDVLVSGTGGQQWVFYGVLLGGAIAGTATAVLSTGPARMPTERGHPLPARRLSR